MTEVTRILNQIEDGDPRVADQLLPLVYDELRKLAAQRLSNEKPGQTLQATALVHEAYIRLVGNDKAQRWDSRGHFFASAAEAMRRILLNRAKGKNRLKRGGRRKRLDLDKIEIALDTPASDLVALDEALSELTDEDSVSAELVKLRFSLASLIEKRPNPLELGRGPLIYIGHTPVRGCTIAFALMTNR